MNCQVCRKFIPKGDEFCMNCGTRKQQIPATSGSQSNQDSVVSATQPTDTVNKEREGYEQVSKRAAVLTNFGGDLILNTPVIFRWLVNVEYGKLSLHDDHLAYSLQPIWAQDIWRILAKIFCLGFDPLTFFRVNGQIQLKNLSVASVLNPQWIKWKMCFVFLIAGIFPLNLWVTNRDFDKVQSFVSALRISSTRAKYLIESQHGK